MYFGHLLVILLCTFSTNKRAVGKKVKVQRLQSGVDGFEVLDDEMNSICAETKNVQEFCVKRNAISVQNTRACSDRKEKLYCRCNYTEPTFLLHKGRCVNNKNVPRYLHGETHPVCKFHLPGHNPPRCQMSPISTLPINITNTRSYSLCTGDVSQELFNCKINLDSLLYSKAGRWRRLWRLDPSGQLGSGQENTLTLEELFDQLISNASRYSGLILSFQATCVMKSKLNVRLRGYPPPDQLQSCLLFKISGSRILSLKSHQMSFTPSNFNSELSLNQSGDNRGKNETDPGITRNTTQQSPTSFPAAELVTDETKINTVDNTFDKEFWYYVMGLCVGAICVMVALMCVVGFAHHRRNRRLRRKIQRKIQGLTRSIANPTYERGVDSGLVMVSVPDVSPSGPPTAAVVSPYAIVYQPLVENTRPYSVNGYNNLYESLRSVRNNPALRRYSYSQYQDLIRARNGNSSPSWTYQEAFVNFETTVRVSFPTSRDSKSSAAASNARCDYATVRKQLQREPGEKFPEDETEKGDLTVMCQSIPSSLQQDGGIASGIDIAARSSSMLSLSSLQFYEEEDQTVQDSNSVDKSDSSVEDQLAQHDIFDTDDGICRLSDLEFTIDSDCSEYDSDSDRDSDFGEVIDETETQSPFYHVLEESNTTPGKQMNPSVSLV